MPEYDKGEQPEGQTVETKSSDSSIAQRLYEIQAEIDGVDQRGPVNVDALKPQSIGFIQSATVPNRSFESEMNPTRLSHRDSALGDHITTARIKKLKKAA